MQNSAAIGGHASGYRLRMGLLGLCWAHLSITTIEGVTLIVKSQSHLSKHQAGFRKRLFFSLPYFAKLCPHLSLNEAWRLEKEALKHGD